MSTQTLPKPATRPAHNFNPVVHHYYKESDLAWSAYSGESIAALCGDVGRTSSGATGQQSNGAIVICPLCATTYAELPHARQK